MREAFGTTPEATRELWRYLLDIDQSQTIESYLMPPDHPLFLLLSEPRRTKYRMGDGLWVRLVDVGAALSGRGYAEDGRVVFDVRDSFCPWNEGRWKLEDGRAAKTDDEPDLRLDVTGLGSVFLGGFTFAELFRACRVEELEARRGRAGRRDVPDGHRALVLRDLLIVRYIAAPRSWPSSPFSSPRCRSRPRILRPSRL